MNKIQLLLLIVSFFSCLIPSQAQISFYVGKHLCVARNIKEKLVFNAVTHNSEALLKKFLKNGGNPNTTDDCGNPVIFYTTYISRLELMKILIEAGADPNSIDRLQNKPLLYYLIERIDQSNDDHLDEILESIKFLIENGADVNSKDKSSVSALIEAVLTRKPRLVELLIAFGAEINYQDSENMTAFSHAARLGDKILKQMLIKAGADINFGVEEYKIKFGKDAFFRAATDGRTDIIEAMLALGTNVNLANDGGKMTALMRTHEQSTVDALLEGGADVNLQDQSGHTALMWAVLFNEKSIVEKLIAAGANVNLINNEGKSALELSTNNKIRSILIKAGAKEN